MLTQEQKDFYEANGFVHVKGLISREEATRLRDECHTLADRLSAKRNIEVAWQAGKDLSEKAKDTKLLHSHDVQFQIADVAKLLLDDRFTSIASDIIGPNVQLHHTKMFIKPPEKGAPFPMHQDRPFFRHSKDSMIAAIVHFDDAPLEKGCLRVVPGSHKLGALEHIAEGSYHLPTDKYPVEEALALPAQAGDAVFFSYLTIHGSGINESNEARTTLLVQMRDPEDIPIDRVHLSYGQGMMLAGIDPLASDYKWNDTEASVATAAAGRETSAMGGPMGGSAMGSPMGSPMAGAGVMGR